MTSFLQEDTGSGDGGPGIRINNVTVRFRIYRDPTPSLKDTLLRTFVSRAGHGGVVEFPALNGLTIDIRGGDRLGIIGLNGAGKSTLLKMIAGIYHPHEGSVTIRGAVTPLMELGAGFDVEQSGRENIYLNGAMLGHSPRAMREIEQSVIEFSELADFIDTPVKYYSSGMFGRLAFSIATMTKPEILLIDEVFSTGDAHFVPKAFRKISELIDSSQIVLLVSHNLAEIQRFCNRVIVLQKGSIIMDAPPAKAVQFYMEKVAKL